MRNKRLVAELLHYLKYRSEIDWREDDERIEQLKRAVKRHKSIFGLTWRRLCSINKIDCGLIADYQNPEAFAIWSQLYTERCPDCWARVLDNKIQCNGCQNFICSSCQREPCQVCQQYYCDSCGNDTIGWSVCSIQKCGKLLCTRCFGHPDQHWYQVLAFVCKDLKCADERVIVALTRWLLWKRQLYC